VYCAQGQVFDSESKKYDAVVVHDVWRRFDSMK